MPSQNTVRRRYKPGPKRQCMVCGLRSVVVETCSCCAQEWIVCHGCGVALTRAA